MGAEIFSGVVLIGTKSLCCSRSIGCRFERYAAHHKPPLFALCCKKQQQQKMPRAHPYTSSLVIPCAHGKLNVKHHRTTPEPEIHGSITAENDEAALARKWYRAPKRTQAAQQQQQCEYIHTCVYKRGRFPQTRDLWRKSASMGYRVGRVSLHAVSRWSRSPGCCGYISWHVFLVSGRISFFFFVFFTSNAHGLLQVRGNLASRTSLLVFYWTISYYGCCKFYGRLGCNFYSRQPKFLVS